MAVSLVLEDVSLRRGTAMVLDGVTLGVSPGERIGVVGRNGAGKSTLLRLMAGVGSPDRGRIVPAGGLTRGFLAQHPPPLVTSVAATVRGEMDVHEFWGDARIRGIAAGLLGISGEEGFEAVPAQSGGELRRVELAALLVADPDLLLLDEPTNHLDIEAVTWLAGYLQTRPGSLVVITHDRWFLDEVCTDTWEVVDANVSAYEGGYASYILARAERERSAAATEQRRRNLATKELAWLRRGPPARTSKPRFRIAAATELIANEPPARDPLELKRVATARLGKQVIDLTDAVLAPAPAAPVVLNGVTLRLGPGDRIGLLGPNGAGKTTLINLLRGAPVDLSQGTLRIGSTVVVGVLDQRLAEFDPDLRTGEWLAQVGTRLEVVGGKELTASALLESFGFGGDRAWTRLGDLSGGELRRLHLLRLMLSGANVLLLDEPSNDLDVETLAVLEDVLDGWPGTLVVVSHDRYLLERVTDDIYAMPGDATLSHLPGGVDDYLALRRSQRERGGGHSGSPDARSASRVAAGGPLEGAALHAARKEMGRLERRLLKIEDSLAVVAAKMASSASDAPTLAELDSQATALVAEQADVEARWLELAEVIGDDG